MPLFDYRDTEHHNIQTQKHRQSQSISCLKHFYSATFYTAIWQNKSTNLRTHALTLAYFCVWPLVTSTSCSNPKCSPHHRSSDWVLIRTLCRRMEWQHLNSKPSWQQRQHRCVLNIFSWIETFERDSWKI